MEQESIIYKNILENMTDGVMTLDLSGRIIALNPAAAKILGLKREDVLGKKFAKIFFEYEGSDDFNQAISNATYESNIAHNKIVDFNTGEKVVSLSITTSFLQSRHSGKMEKAGVIAVFRNVTGLKKLQDEEIRLTEDLKANHAELKEAYLKIDESNQDLKVALKKIHVIRIVATFFIIAIFLGTGLLIWNKIHISKTKIMSTSFERPGDISRIRTITVKPRQVSSTISLPGIMEPLNIVNVVSPFTGKVKDKFFDYGESVTKGQMLIKMDTSELDIKYRDEKDAYLKTIQNLKKIENWENEFEVKSSRRSLIKAQNSLESQEKKLKNTERLLKKGIVPASEYDTAKEQFQNLQLDFKAAQDTLQSVFKKGSKENLDIARLETENARTKMKRLKEQISQATILAPVSGVVILPDLSKQKKDSKAVEKGISFELGEEIVSIGDFEGLSVKTSVDEVDISKIKKGQKVIVSGDAFSDMSLDGVISNISSQAIKEGGIPSFDVKVNIVRLNPEQRERLSFGMSAELKVVFYNKPDALMVPVGAVNIKGTERFVKIKNNNTQEIQEIKVETGITTLDSVEILKGLKPGDEVVVDKQ